MVRVRDDDGQDSRDAADSATATADTTTADTADTATATATAADTAAAAAADTAAADSTPTPTIRRRDAVPIGASPRPAVRVAGARRHRDALTGTEQHHTCDRQAPEAHHP